MTKQLIVNGIDWLDLRMIGLKCWFWNNYPKESSVDVLVKVGNNAIGTPLFFTENNKDTYYSCRLAQGDKTPYDGKGQPVPDGVRLRIWHKEDGYLTDDLVLSERCCWTNETTIEVYQVQEQKVEKKYDYQDFCRDVKEIGGESTTRIPTTVLEEIIECLARSRAGALIMQDWKDIGDFNKELTKEIATIDKLLKELRRL